MDFLIELLLELTVEGAVYGANSKTIPRWLRWMLRGLLTLVFMGGALVFAWLAVCFDGEFVLRLILAAVAVVLGGFYLAFLRAWCSREKGGK